MTSTTCVWSIGHSNHDMPRFLELLRGVGVEVVADVRSQPYSRFSPQFNRREFKEALAEAGFAYAFLGDELGGRPPEPDLYDADGHVLYGEVAESERFRSGLDRLLSGAGRFHVAMLCSEEDPTNCHRRLLVTRVLAGQGIAVVHIRGDGSAETESELDARLRQHSQSALFGEELSPWRSTRSVSRSTALVTSSRH
jgi:uncharacterized protein (DUF488 family)